MADPDESTNDLVVLTEREIALLCSALDRARTDTRSALLVEYDELYTRWSEIAIDESTMIVSDPTVGGHRMHAVQAGADERHRLRIVVEAHVVFLLELDDEDRAGELLCLVARLRGTL